MKKNNCHEWMSCKSVRGKTCEFASKNSKECSRLPVECCFDPAV